MSNYLDPNQLQAHFEQKPLSFFAISNLKVDAVNAFLHFDSDCEVCFYEVYDFLANADLSAADFDDIFQRKFGDSLTALEDYEGESPERLVYLISEHFESALQTLKVIIAEREFG